MSLLATPELVARGPVTRSKAIRSPGAVASIDTLLTQYLNAYWLRPENAFWTVLRSRAWAREAVTSRSLDLSCGDGVFSFIHCGGQLGIGFDTFQVVDQSDRVSRENSDMFDRAVDVNWRPEIVVRPEGIIDVGTDLKWALLSKAAALEFYGALIRHNNEAPLPFENATFDHVYCNAVKWVRNAAGLLREIARVTRPGGRIVLHCKLDSMKRYTLRGFERQLGEPLLALLERGRFATWPSLASRSEWERRFERAGLTIVDELPIATRTHAHIWDIGLRPIAPLLVRMANSLTAVNRAAIKRDWIELFKTLLRPLCSSDFDVFARNSTPAEMQYVLTRAE